MAVRRTQIAQHTSNIDLAWADEGKSLLLGLGRPVVARGNSMTAKLTFLQAQLKQGRDDIISEVKRGQGTPTGDPRKTMGRCARMGAWAHEGMRV